MGVEGSAPWRTTPKLRPVVERDSGRWNSTRRPPGDMGESVDASATTPKLRPVVERDSGVEAPPAVELHVGAEAVDAGRHRGGESVDAGNCVHPADGQRQPFPGWGRPSRIPRRLEAEEPRSLLRCRWPSDVPLIRRQMGCVMAHPAADALRQQVGQGSGGPWHAARRGLTPAPPNR